MTAKKHAKTVTIPASALKFEGVRGTLSLPFGWTHPVVSRAKVGSPRDVREYAIWTESPQWFDTDRYVDGVEEGTITEIPAIVSSTGKEAFLVDEATAGHWFVYFDFDRLSDMNLGTVTDACIRQSVAVHFEPFRHPLSGRELYAAICTTDVRDEIRIRMAASIKVVLESKIQESWPNIVWGEFQNFSRIWVDATASPADAMEAITYAAMAMQRTSGAIQLKAWLEAICQRWAFSSNLEVWQDRILSLIAKCDSCRFQTELEIRRRMQISEAELHLSLHPVPTKDPEFPHVKLEFGSDIEFIPLHPELETGLKKYRAKDIAALAELASEMDIKLDMSESDIQYKNVESDIELGMDELDLGIDVDERS